MIDVLTKNRGDRVKSLLKERGIKQNALAKELDDMNPVVLNDKLAGRKPLTEYNLQDIARILDVRIEYLMLYDDDPTPAHKVLRVIQQAQHEGDLLLTGVASFASLNGYTLHAPFENATNSIEDAIKQIKNGYSIEKDGKKISLSVEAMSAFENHLSNIVDAELQYLFSMNGGGNNG
jgi:transcriptional regulator with XRE-family HTH domain